DKLVTGVQTCALPISRYQAHSEGVRGGFLTPNEARGLEDFQPMPGGDLLYMQQQMVPLSDLGKTKATEPLDTQPRPAGSSQSAEIGRASCRERGESGV